MPVFIWTLIAYAIGRLYCWLRGIDPHPEMRRPTTPDDDGSTDDDLFNFSGS